MQSESSIASSKCWIETTSVADLKLKRWKKAEILSLESFFSVCFDLNADVKEFDFHEFVQYTTMITFS